MSAIAQESKLLAKHSMIYGFGTVINSVVAILLLPIYTRFLTPTDYGVKELIGLTVDVVGILLATAVSSGVMRFYFEYDDEKRRNEVISTASLGLSAIAFLAFLFLSFFTRPMASYIIDSPELYYYFNISLISMWLNAVNGIGFAYLRAKKKSVQFVVLSLLRLVIVISLNIYFIVFLKLGVLGILLSTLIVAIITTFVLNIPILFKVGIRFSNSIFRELIIFGLPLVPAQIGGFFVHLSDRFFLKAYVSIADAGLYSLGHRFGTLTGTFISTPFNQIWQPRRLELYKKEGSNELFGRIFTYYIAIVAFAGLAVAVLTKEVLMIMASPEFWAAYSIVPLIVLANIIFNLNSQLDIGILIRKKTKYLGFIDGSNGILILIANFLLIPKFGIYGAAYAKIIAYVYQTSLYYYFSNKIYKIHIEFMRLFKIFSSALLLFLICTYVQNQSVFISFFYKFLLILCFPITLLIFNFFTLKEIEFVKILFNNLFNYFKPAKN
jgi:O-antigen/teichoic acid export membrane protein